MTDTDTGFEGYVKARLEDISRVQAEQRTEIQSINTQVGTLAVSVGALKATARAWGIFAGVLSGIASGILAKFWRP